nr:MAG TPA: hypothetical protein [Caudoviricetes sp.]
MTLAVFWLAPLQLPPYTPDNRSPHIELGPHTWDTLLITLYHLTRYHPPT